MNVQEIYKKNLDTFKKMEKEFNLHYEAPFYESIYDHHLSWTLNVEYLKERVSFVK